MCVQGEQLVPDRPLRRPDDGWGETNRTLSRQRVREGVADLFEDAALSIDAMAPSTRKPRSYRRGGSLRVNELVPEQVEA